MAVGSAQHGGGGGMTNGKVSSNNNTSSSESEDWGGEPWTVDCPCGVTFDDGEEMVECDECSVWVHTTCCQVSKSVSTYVCDKCKEKKRKEKEESEVAQLLVELPGKSSCDVPVQRKVHEHGVPGGDASIFVGVSSVFSQQLWKCAGYVRKLLHVQYTEVPNWSTQGRTEGACLFELCKSPLKESPPSRSSKKLKMEHQESKVSNGEGHPGGDEEGGGRRERNGKKMEVIRHTKHKYKFRGLKDDKHNQNSLQNKRAREDVKEQQYSRKKMRDSKEHRKTLSPKNPKAMKKSAVQEFMDGDVRLCTKCMRPEPTSSDDQGANASKPFVCIDCQKPRPAAAKKQDPEGPPPMREDQCKKLKSDPTNSPQNLSPVATSTELPKQLLDSSLELPSAEVESESGLAKQQKAPKPLHGTEKLEQKGCQLSVKTTFPKSEIPSPASINSGGPSVKSFGDNASPSSPTHQLKPAAAKASHLPPSAASAAKAVVKPSAQSSKPAGCSKQTGGTSATSTQKKSDSKSSSAPIKSPSSQPAASKQFTTCKMSLAHPSSKSGHGSLLPRKPANKDGGDKSKDEKGSLFKSSASSVSGASPAAPLNDEELALLLHQELNSSPRVPRVPRVRQGISSASPSNILTKRTLGSSTSSKEHRLMWRKRHRDESCRGNSSRFSETPHMSGSSRRHEEGTKTDDEAVSSRAESPDLSEGAAAGGGGGGGGCELNNTNTATTSSEAGAVSSAAKKHSGAAAASDTDETCQGGDKAAAANEAGLVSPRQRV